MGIELCLRLIDDRQTAMWIGARCTQPWEMLQCSYNLTTLLQTFKIGVRHWGDSVGIGRIHAPIELTSGDARLVDVHDRREIEIESETGEIFCRLLASGGGSRQVACRADHLLARTIADQRLKTVDIAALLVCRDPQWQVGVLCQASGELSYLRRIGDGIAEGEH